VPARRNARHRVPAGAARAGVRRAFRSRARSRGAAARELARAAQRRHDVELPRPVATGSCNLKYCCAARFCSCAPRDRSPGGLQRPVPNAGRNAAVFRHIHRRLRAGKTVQTRRRRATVRRSSSARATAPNAGAGRPRGAVPPSQETDGARSRESRKRSRTRGKPLTPARDGRGGSSCRFPFVYSPFFFP
jgi:hypothetical protein